MKEHLMIDESTEVLTLVEETFRLLVQNEQLCYDHQNMSEKLERIESIV